MFAKIHFKKVVQKNDLGESKRIKKPSYKVIGNRTDCMGDL